jgi:hypothetical protein
VQYWVAGAHALRAGDVFLRIQFTDAIADAAE